jgi:hypothetical protein
MRRLAVPSGQEGSISSPAHGALTSPTYPRVVLLLLLKQHFTPPPTAPPTPSPRCILANPVQPPTPWKRGCRTCGRRTALRHAAHWAEHPRDILADGYTRYVATCLRALCCRKTMSQSCLSQLWFSNIQPYGQKSPTAKASLPTRRTISADT